MSNDGIDIAYVNQGVAGNNVPECNAAKAVKTRTLTPLILVRIQVPQPIKSIRYIVTELRKTVGERSPLNRHVRRLKSFEVERRRAYAVTRCVKRENRFDQRNADAASAVAEMPEVGQNRFLRPLTERRQLHNLEITL